MPSSLQVQRMPERDSETEEADHTYACFCCHSISDLSLSCGHLCCESCLSNLKDHICGLCRARSTEEFAIRSNELDPKCQACDKIKLWLAACGHVTCTCDSSRCLVCDHPITTLRKLFLSN